MRRRAGRLSTLVCAILAFAASAAQAHIVSVSVTCTSVTFSYTHFASEPDNTVNESITLDGSTIVSKQFSFNGPSGVDPVPITVSSETHTVDASANWNTNGAVGSGGSGPQTLSDCGGDHLVFDTEPNDAVINEAITGSQYSPSGPPVTVEIENASNAIVASNAPVTISLAANPGGGTLGGTDTVNAVGGVAKFSDLTINAPANGYTLAASGSGLAGTTSTTFEEQNQEVPCLQNLVCQTSVGTSAGGLQVVASPVPSTTNAGYLTESVNSNNDAPLACLGGSSDDHNVYEFYVSSINRSKVATLTIKVPFLPALDLAPLLGSQTVCFGAPYDFVVSGGGPAPAGPLPDGSAGYVGLLPKCSAAGATVCIAGISSQLDLAILGYDVIVTVDVPAGLPGDPYMG